MVYKIARGCLIFYALVVAHVDQVSCEKDSSGEENEELKEADELELAVFYRASIKLKHDIMVYLIILILFLNLPEPYKNFKLIQNLKKF